MCKLVKELFIVVFFGLSVNLFFMPHNVLACNFDFSGTVLYDSQACNCFMPGYGQEFTGSLSQGDDALFFKNTDASIFYEDFGSVTDGYFEQAGGEYFYAFSQGPGEYSQMGMIWWFDPRGINVGTNSYSDAYGLVFYLDGSGLYTPSKNLAKGLAEYLDTGVFPLLLLDGITPLDYWGCQISSGVAFLGIINAPLGQPSPVPLRASAVPLPASVWFLGSGLLFLMRRRK